VTQNTQENTRGNIQYNSNTVSADLLPIQHVDIEKAPAAWSLKTYLQQINAKRNFKSLSQTPSQIGTPKVC
jgi:hypothetical protein